MTRRVLAWVWSLHATQPIAHAIAALAAVAVAGLALGSVKVRGIGLGTAGVLFAGILFGHFGERIDHDILDFVKEFGLVLFVFTIGLQLGPGFFAALRAQGARLNALAAAIVVLGTVASALGARILGLAPAAAVGILAGATTNTPSLGAAQQTLSTLPGVSAEVAALPGLAYAVAYPIGIAGIIGSLLLIKLIFRIDAVREAEEFRAERQRSVEALERATLIVENRNLDGVPAGDVPGAREAGVVISRLRRGDGGAVHVATATTELRAGDQILVVGTRSGLERFARVVGRAVESDLLQAPGPVTTSRVVVTRRSALGRSLGELGLDHLDHVTATRLSRADVEMAAAPGLRLQFGDVLQVVGEPDGVASAAQRLGNSLKALNETQFIPLFTGIALGVLAGTLPISFPGLPVPIRLGLAGGPLVVAIALSRLGYIGRLVWYMPITANLALRELGITLFLACVGLKAGEQFFATVLTATGLLWLLCAIGVTMIPLVAIGALARGVFEMNFVTLSGLLAGSTTDPPALAFAGGLARSDSPSVAYATVYPLSMLLRIVAAQALTLILCR